jgi:hypothetical protein
MIEIMIERLSLKKDAQRYTFLNALLIKSPQKVKKIRTNRDVSLVGSTLLDNGCTDSTDSTDWYEFFQKNPYQSVESVESVYPLPPKWNLLFLPNETASKKSKF